MSFLLSAILAFYPAALIWSLIPENYLSKLDSLSSGGLIHFLIRLVAFAIIFFISYKVIDKFCSRFSGRTGALSFIFAIISFLLLLLITFYQILPGPEVYKAPIFVSNYILKLPFSFVAVLFPLIYLFFE